MTAGEKYVAAAYGIVLLAVLLWIAIVATKLVRLERELSQLAELATRFDEYEPRSADG
jgi:hypothetical protein